MALTHVDRLRIYLADAGVGATPVEKLSATIPDSGPLQLPHPQIVESSVRVLADEGGSPLQRTVILSTDWVTLPDSELIAETAAVASDRSLGIIYREQLDYEIDLHAGKIRRVAGGAIADGASVSVWYRAYRVFDPGIDYTVEYTTGRIRALSGGALLAGQHVLIDYTPVGVPVSDSLLEEAVREADRRVSEIVAPEYALASDPDLSSAATYLGLSLVALSLAGAALTAPGGHAISAAWREWGEQWRLQAERLLSRFLPPAAAQRPLQLTRRAR